VNFGVIRPQKLIRPEVNEPLLHAAAAGDDDNNDGDKEAGRCDNRTRHRSVSLPYGARRHDGSEWDSLRTANVLDARRDLSSAAGGVRLLMLHVRPGSFMQVDACQLAPASSRLRIVRI
jgi:hypothetical protein